MSIPHKIVINTENWSTEHKQRVIELLSGTAAVFSEIVPSDPDTATPENPFKHFKLDEKLQTLSALTTAFTATKGSYINSDVEKKIGELLESFQE